MDVINNPGLDRRILRRMRNGDQEILSYDTSFFREGSGWQLPAGSPLYVLAGNQIVMKYWSHNCAIQEDGKIGVRDDPGACGLWMYCEDETTRFFGAPTGAKGTPPVFTLFTTYNNITGAWTYVGGITPSQTAGIVGTTTNNNANAGSVGEVLTATIATPGTTLTTAVTANVILTPFLSLTAGDWDVWGQIAFLPAATTSITQIAFGISATSATLPTAGTGGLVQNTYAAFVPGAINQCHNVTMTRVSIASTTSYYLVAQAAFTVSTLSAFGTLYARRVR